jgi:hypothetical protein
MSTTSPLEKLTKIVKKEQSSSKLESLLQSEAGMRSALASNRRFTSMSAAPLHTAASVGNVAAVEAIVKVGGCDVNAVLDVSEDKIFCTVCDNAFGEISPFMIDFYSMCFKISASHYIVKRTQSMRLN